MCKMAREQEKGVCSVFQNALHKQTALMDSCSSVVMMDKQGKNLRRVLVFPQW